MHARMGASLTQRVLRRIAVQLIYSRTKARASPIGPGVTKSYGSTHREGKSQVHALAEESSCSQAPMARAFVCQTKAHQALT